RDSEADRRHGGGRPDPGESRRLDISQSEPAAEAVRELIRPKIEVRQASKTYAADRAAVLALRGTDLSVGDGEFGSVVGPAGCGKSTLRYLVGGFISAEGEVLVDGRPITGPGTERGIVFQEYALFPWLTVRGNIAFGLERQGMPAAQREWT